MMHSFLPVPFSDKNFELQTGYKMTPSDVKLPIISMLESKIVDGGKKLWTINVLLLNKMISIWISLEEELFILY